MIRMNLLPPELRHREDKALKKQMICFAAGVAALLLLVYSYGAVRISALEEQLQTDAASYRLLAPTEERRLALLETDRHLQQKYRILEELSADRYAAYGIFLRLGMHTASDAWLTQAALDERRQLLLKGVAKEYAAVAQLLEALKADDLFENAALLRSEFRVGESEPDGAVYFEIQLQCKKL